LSYEYKCNYYVETVISMDIQTFLEHGKEEYKSHLSVMGNMICHWTTYLIVGCAIQLDALTHVTVI